MIFRKIFFYVFLFLTMHSAWALNDCPKEPPVPTQEQMAEMRKNAKDRGFLWTITKNGKTSHLYGSIHLSKLDWRVPGAAVMQAVRQSDALAFELNLQDTETTKTLNEQLTKSTSFEIPAQLKERIARLPASNCLSSSEWATLPPETKVAFLSGLTLVKEGFHAGYGIELVFTTMANRMRKPVIAIETVQEQMSALAPINPTHALLSYEKLLASVESGASNSVTLKTLKAWAESDLATLNSYADWCLCMNSADDRLQIKKILDDRNLVMAERIDKLNSQYRSVFTAVGSLHMVGETGLPKLFEKLGYTVERVF
jgi:uncharacterized protein